eukprot:jgi/Botrbrau1/12350/Bobra.0239s0002.2
MEGNEQDLINRCLFEGDRLSAEGQWDKAIAAYSGALKCDGITVGDLVRGYSNRCAAFSRLSRSLRDIPAESSESRALSGFDPAILSELAVKDAQRLTALEPNNIQGFILLGEALLLSERYEECQNAYVEGLSLDPTNQELQNALLDLQKLDAFNLHKTKQRVVTSRDELDCLLCFKLLFEPVTTPCGHSFCRGCLKMSLSLYNRRNNSNKCPLCRTVLHVGGSLPISLTLANIIEKSFPSEYAERRAEHQGHRSSEDAHEPPLPLFVMQCIFPGERMALNIFEPRYRLMVRRCLEGTRRFGMAALVNGQLHPTACECEIVEAEPQADGCGWFVSSCVVHVL